MPGSSTQRFSIKQDIIHPHGAREWDIEKEVSNMVYDINYLKKKDNMRKWLGDGTL